ncbi:iron-siderophore ABC transporter substrate-binding protein [Thalassospira mesophila]|uniref:ABC transporter substrate-binding protein n=1 Tax=Thalassospira mesophila TaxID=1293891 RepID=UPI000A1FB581|nr:iron-siderophore ABC transporter substrate-binding protein [Thalassospira mesophila]
MRRTFMFAIFTIGTLCAMAFHPLPVHAESKTYTHEMGSVAFETPPTRIAVTNWSLTETVIALGLAPVAIADPQDYREWVVKPDLPAGFVDIGQRQSPNMEALRKAKPDLILISKELAMAYDALSEIAPTMVISTFNNAKPALQSIINTTRQIAAVTGREQRANEILQLLDETLAQDGARIRAILGPDQRLAVIRINSDAQINVFGPPSLPNTVLAAMNIPTAYNGETTGWGFARGGLELLAPFANDTIAFIEPTPAPVRQRIVSSPLWKMQGFARNNRVYQVPPVWTYGGVYSAMRFADLLAAQIENGPYK